MADKIIKLRIDVTKIFKQWLFAGQQGTYLDATLLYNDVQDQYGNNGRIVQDVPKDIYEKEKNLPQGQQKTRGQILGNGKVWANTVNQESSPGYYGPPTQGQAANQQQAAQPAAQQPAAAQPPAQNYASDLPF